jgi:anaerobic dimethyl sulfoxide reductase subunit B (iron-sulfur subunit)
MTYAFSFDASSCSGCKACQVACKDKNNLTAGVLWRRVYEISGGTWTNVGARSSRPELDDKPGVGESSPYPVWETDVFAYSLSIACNHCVHPKCAGVCPTDAFVVRDDGIVYIDESKCMGCGYCSWACPYSAPRYDHEAGVMTKCNFCYDNIDAGLPPACVAACPMRVLEFATLTPVPGASLNSSHRGSGELVLWELPATAHPFPLPNFSRTEPHLAIKPHTGMLNNLGKVVSNREEIKPIKAKFKISPPGRADFGEIPLVAFTLLGQMAAGMAVLSFFSGPLITPLLITLGGLIGLAGLAALLHLGTPSHAWRAVLHLKKSSLSREILVFVLFGGSWFLSLALPGMGKLPLTACGIALVYSMAQVYRLRSIPAWNTNRTLLAFTISALLLGGFGLKIVGFFANTEDSEYLPLAFATFALIGAFWLSIVDNDDQAHQTARNLKVTGRLRLGLIGLGMVGALVMLFAPGALGKWISVPIFVIVLVEEGLGRWLFYEHLHQRNL